MSAYYPKDSNTMEQALRVQELIISGADAGLFTISGGNCFVLIREPVQKVFLASVKVDSSNTVTQFAQSSIVICDSSLLTAGGNQGAIELVGLASVAANDVIVVRYSVLEHL